MAVRKARIPENERDLFERYGENVIGLVLAGGLGPAAPDLVPVYTNPAVKEHARDWLTERSDRHEARETRLEILEWAIVGLIVVEIVIAILQYRNDYTLKSMHSTTPTVAAPQK